MVLAEAANVFLKQLPAFRLVFVGRAEIDSLRRIERAVEDDIRSRVVAVHPMPQRRLAELMRTAAVFAMPSLLESFGTAWAEAMASGVPVVGSNRSCGPEVVPNERAGLLVDPLDVSSVSGAIVRLATDPIRSEEMRLFGRQYAVEHYSLERIAKDTLDFYGACLQLGGAR
jgi:starch synthase